MLRMTLYFTYSAVSNQRTFFGGLVFPYLGLIATKVVDNMHHKGKKISHLRW
jgi:hypothetical protein